MSNEMTIVIARQYGSGGRKIGKKLAEDLNLPFYDKELIALAAKESGVSQEFFEDGDEKASNSLLYSLIMGSFTYGSHVEPTENMTLNDKLFFLQANIIKKLAQHGPCVIVGRCADYILRDCKNVFNVFIYADQFARMERIVEEYGINPLEAAQRLVQIDKQRANYYNYYTNKKWDDLENYHLTIDSSSVGIDNAVELIKSAVTMVEPEK